MLRRGRMFLFGWVVGAFAWAGPGAYTPLVIPLFFLRKKNNLRDARYIIYYCIETKLNDNPCAPAAPADDALACM
jgi:hypothetical protein